MEGTARLLSQKYHLLVFDLGMGRLHEVTSQALNEKVTVSHSDLAVL